ncbi:MAG: recombinase family protein [Methanobrevibacter sp.]|jgi:site-specific DNA recombinase|nr:recombinase family protein [Candidatus Methanovirga meridionalis]
MKQYTAIYVRVSTEEQVENYSIESQINLALEICKNDNIENYKLFIDDGYSGRSLKRPKIKELISEIYKSLIDKVIITDIDRLSRNVVDLSTLIELFINYKVLLISAYGNAKITTADDRLIMRFKGSIAQHTSEKISEHVLRGLKGGLEKGDYIFAHAPYGYVKCNDNKKMLEPVLNEIENVKKIFYYYSVKDLSIEKIKIQLMQENINIKTNAISRILKNEKYTGQFKYQNQYFSGFGLLTLITKEEFEYVQQKLKGHYKEKINDYLFFKKVVCFDCKKILSCVSTVKKNKTYLYYTCLNENCSSYYKRINENFLIVEYSKKIVNLYNKNHFTFHKVNHPNLNYYKITSLDQLSKEQIKETIIKYFKVQAIKFK